VDWTWLPRGNPNLFIGGTAPGRTVLPPKMAVSLPSGLISLREKGGKARSSINETGVFKAVVLPAGTSFGTGYSKLTSSVWASMHVNLAEPVEAALVARVHQVAMAHVVDSASTAYVGSWKTFVMWCGTRLSERCSLPASDYIVAIYLHLVSVGAKNAPRQRSLFFPKGVVFPHRLLRELRKFVGSNPASLVFRVFNGRMVANNHNKTQ